MNLFSTVLTGGIGGLLFGTGKNALKTSKIKVPKQNIGKDIASYIKGLKKGMPNYLKFEEKFRPKFQDLNLQEAGSFLNRKGGYYDIQQESQNKQAERLDQARTQGIASMAGNAGATRGLLSAMSPEGAAQVQAAQAQAATAQAAAGGLTGQEERSAQQFARESSASRGRVMDNSSFASELMNRDSMLTGKRQEAAQATQMAGNMAENFYSSPGLNILSATPQSFQAGNNAAGVGLASIGQSTPQLANPDTAINLGAANNANKLAADQANAKMKADKQAAMLSAISGLIGTGTKMATGGMA